MSNAKNTDIVVNSGCRLNLYESEVIKNALLASNVEDVVVFNTCAVTAEAEKQARQAIRKLKREKPHKKIVVTGCAAQVSKKIFSNMPEVDLIVGNDKKSSGDFFANINTHLANAEQNPENRVLVGDIMSKREESTFGNIVHFEDRTRVFVEIQNGCNHRCTYCVIPYARGNSRSIPVAQVLLQIESLLDQGFKEIVLTGVDITSYGEDFVDNNSNMSNDLLDILSNQRGKFGLGALCKLILKTFPNLTRLRLSSIDVAEFEKDLWDLFANEERMMPYLHISLQSGDDGILKLMKRRHKRSNVFEFCARMRSVRPNIAFGADIIHSFPTETEEAFENSLTLLQDVDISFIHSFSFSPRQGTLAAVLKGQIDGLIKKQRSKRLAECCKSQKQKFLQGLIGKQLSIIVERDGNCRAENFAYVKTDWQSFVENDLHTKYNVQMLPASGNYCQRPKEGTILQAIGSGVSGDLLIVRIT